MGKVIAIVLAAGKGTRMGTKTSKQFLEIDGKPVFIYALEAFEKSNVDEIILVTGKEHVEPCRIIASGYNIRKLVLVIPGGEERYDSVFNALNVIYDGDYVLIHDSARPMITPEIINSTIEEVKKSDACVVAMPLKDTVKLEDGKGFVKATPDRNLMWTIQTPQAFKLDIIKKAYEEVLKGDTHGITDDSMILEKYNPDIKVKLIKGDYKNIKITTIEDLEIAKIFLKN